MVAVLLLVFAGAMPVAAQTRIEIRRTPRAEPGDSTERLLRKLQRQVDSLSRMYTESPELSTTERRRVELELETALARLEESRSALGERLLRIDEHFQYRIGPGAANEAAAAAMSRALMAQHGQPRGWIGFLAQGAALERQEMGERIIRYFAYPRIMSVDPGSPAQRAGIAPGDTLLAYNGRDVRENDIAFSQLLQPNRRVMVRVSRDGRVRDIPVVVAVAPSRVVIRRRDEERDSRETWVVPGMPDAPSFPRSPMAPTPASGGARGVITRMVPPTPMPATAPMPARGMLPGISLVLTGVAGAQLATITEGLARTVGVSTGVLVTNAPAGSPAGQSGLTDGDVIAKVDGQSVRTVMDVRMLVAAAAEAGERSVELELVRNKRTQKLTLRW